MYFSNIQFVEWSHAPCCTAVVDRTISFGTVLNYVKSGSIFFSRKGEPVVTLPEGTAYWTFPEQHYYYGAFPESSWDQAWIAARGERIDAMRQGEFIPSDIGYQRVENRALFETTYYGLQDTLDGPHHHARAAHMFESLWLQLQEERESKGLNDPIRQGLDRVIKQMQANPAKDMDIQQAASDLEISIVHFRRLFKRYVGIPPREYEVTLRMRYAANLICSREQSITAIAHSLGYDNLHYFSRVFKHTIGLSPRQYREVTLKGHDVHCPPGTPLPPSPQID